MHYSEGPTDQSPRSIQDFHQDGRGWVDIGYNFLVDVSGRIFEGRGWEVSGAHAPGHNVSGIGVCMIGRDGDATPAAKAAIRWLYDEACRLAGRRLKMLGHRDVFATDCPGDELYAWVRAGMPADLEDDVSWSEEIPEGPGFPQKWQAGTHLRYQTVLAQQERASLARIEARLAGLTDEVDEDAIVQGLLAGLAPARIAEAVAAALPAELAGQVADELGTRLSRTEE